MPAQHCTSSTDRVALAIPEARLEHGLSQRRLAQLSGVSVSTIRKAERGGRVDPALLIKLGTAVMVLDTYRSPRLEDDLAALFTPVQPSLVTLAQIREGWAS